MIIENLYRRVELKDLDVPGGYFYMAIQIGEDIYRLAFELNNYYGLFLRQWSVNLNTKTSVRFRGLSSYVDFDAAQSLVGVRKFEHESLVWEFLLKPMGIQYSTVKELIENGKLLNHIKIEEILNQNKIQHTILHYRFA